MVELLYNHAYNKVATPVSKFPLSRPGQKSLPIVVESDCPRPTTQRQVSVRERGMRLRLSQWLPCLLRVAVTASPSLHALYQQPGAGVYIPTNRISVHARRCGNWSCSQALTNGSFRLMVRGSLFIKACTICLLSSDTASCNGLADLIPVNKVSCQWLSQERGG